jgi:hypothetical protein
MFKISRGKPESIEWFLEDQYFSPSNYFWLLPHPLPPLPSASCLSFSVFLCVDYRSIYWRESRGGAKSYEDEKARSSINSSILSGVNHRKKCTNLMKRSLKNCPSWLLMALLKKLSIGYHFVTWPPLQIWFLYFSPWKKNYKFGKIQEINGHELCGMQGLQAAVPLANRDRW